MTELTKITDADIEAEKRVNGHVRSQNVQEAITKVIVWGIYSAAVLVALFVVAILALYILSLCSPSSVTPETVHTIEGVFKIIFGVVGGYIVRPIAQVMGKAD